MALNLGCWEVQVDFLLSMQSDGRTGSVNHEIGPGRQPAVTTDLGKLLNEWCILG
jgi:hypothetical protein